MTVDIVFSWRSLIVGLWWERESWDSSWAIHLHPFPFVGVTVEIPT